MMISVFKMMILIVQFLNLLSLVSLISIKVRELLHQYGQEYLDLQCKFDNGTVNRRRRTSSYAQEGDSHEGNEGNNGSTLIELDEEIETQSAPPRKRTTFDIFSLFGDAHENGAAQTEDIDISTAITVELNKYISEPVTTPCNQESGEFDVLKWWKSNESKFPMLGKLCRFFHAIPATSSPSERLFSVAGSTVTEKRTRISPELLNSVLFLNSNSDLKLPNESTS